MAHRKTKQKQGTETRKVHLGVSEKDSGDVGNKIKGLTQREGLSKQEVKTVEKDSWRGAKTEGGREQPVQTE